MVGFRDSFIVPVINCMTSFFGGFVIFSFIGFMATVSGQGVPDVIQAGDYTLSFYFDVFLKFHIVNSMASVL